MATPDPATLLNESDWLHRLALRLVRDPGLAADAAQEALLIGLDRPAPEGATLRAWLAGVLRQRLRSARRAAARRERREGSRAQAAEPQREPEAGASLERLELHQRLLARVRELDEPYRTVIVLRYLEDRTPAEIAARLGLPTKTVYTRLERALARLRQRLDGDYGERARWALMLAPWPIDPSPPLALSLTPLLAMKALPWCLSAAVLLLAGLTWRLLDQAPPVDAALEASAAPTPAGRREATAAAPLSPARLPPTPAEGRLAEPAALPAAGAPAAVAAPVEALEGRVLDLDGRGWGGVELSFKGSTAAAAPWAISSADGSFREPWPAETSRGRLQAEGQDLATLWSPMLTRGRPPGDLVIWVGPARRYAGLVLDGQGRPVAGARLRLTLADELLAKVSPGVFQTGVPQAEASSDGQGRFDLGQLAWAPGSRLTAEATGFRGAELVLPEQSALDLLLVLEPLGPRGERLAGRVVDAEGRPRPGARVGTPQVSALSDVNGRFELELSAPQLEQAGQRLTALAPGFLPVTFDLSAVAPGQRQSLEIVLGEAAAGIAGHLRRADGRPVPGALVWTEDGTPFGRVLSEISGMAFEVDYDLEGLIAPSPSQTGGRESRCDSDGAFALEGLLRQRYSLWALDPESGELCGPFPVEAPAAALELMLPGEERPVPVAGRITNLAGAALPGVAVYFERRRQAPDGAYIRREIRPEPPLLSDAEGRFRFAGLCVAGTHLIVERSPGDQRRIALEQQPDLTDVWIALPAPCRLQVTLNEPGSAETLQLLDGQGRPLMLSIQAGEVLLQANAMQIDGGISDWIDTDESAVFLELSGGTGGTRRLPIQLTPGSANRLSF